MESDRSYTQEDTAKLALNRMGSETDTGRQSQPQDEEAQVVSEPVEEAKEDEESKGKGNTFNKGRK